MDFKNAKELLALCVEQNMRISDVMRQREIEEGETSGELCDARKLITSWESLPVDPYGSQSNPWVVCWAVRQRGFRTGSRGKAGEKVSAGRCWGGQ